MLEAAFCLDFARCHRLKCGFLQLVRSASWPTCVSRFGSVDSSSPVCLNTPGSSRSFESVGAEHTCAAGQMEANLACHRLRHRADFRSEKSMPATTSPCTITMSRSPARKSAEDGNSLRAGDHLFHDGKPGLQPLRSLDAIDHGGLAYINAREFCPSPADHIWLHRARPEVRDNLAHPVRPDTLYREGQPDE